MTIKIVLPEGDDVRSSNGTRVYTESGHEIKNISRIQIDMRPNTAIEATITVSVSEIENLEGVEGIIVAEKKPGIDDEEGQGHDHKQPNQTGAIQPATVR